MTNTAPRAYEATDIYCNDTEGGLTLLCFQGNQLIIL